MKNQNKIEVWVFDFENQHLKKASVEIRSERMSERLQINANTGAYETIKFQADRYTITVSSEGLETQYRSVFIGNSGISETFILGKKEMPFYYRGTVKVPFSPDNGSFGVVFESPELKEIEGILRKVEKDFNLKMQKPDENYRKNGVFVFEYPVNISEEEKAKIRVSIQRRKNIGLVAPILKQSEKNISLLTDEIIVRFKGGIEEKEIQRIAREFSLKTIRSIPYAGNAYHFKVPIMKDFASLDICTKLVEMGVVEYAEPNLYHTYEEDAIIPNNYLFPEQWDHPIINTPDAWQVLNDNLGAAQRFGSPDVVVAVVDSGVNSAHQQFSGNVSNGQPKILTSFDFANMVANNNSLAGSHGSCCASASVGFTTVSSGGGGVPDGTVGVAGNCRLMGIRQPGWGAGLETNYSDMYIWTGGFNPNSITAGFPAQLARGADIITNSFGYSVNVPISGLMKDTFDFLTTYGRGGKGILLFFSAGNDNVNLDATFRRPWGMYRKCMSVAASSLAIDGITEIKANYSNFGTPVSFCVPSSRGGEHNPPNSYRAFTGTILHNFRTTSLSSNANIGNSSINVSSVDSMSNRDTLVIENFGNLNAEVRFVSEDPVSNPITLNSVLVNNHSSGTNILYSDGNAPRNRQLQTTLSANANAGISSITVASTAGMVNGQAILIGNPSLNISPSEAKTITGLTATTISFSPALFNNKASGTVVNFGNRDYRNNFGGTSYSTPVCAGVAALMLSANNRLTWMEVREILRGTAAKIDPTNNDAVGRWLDVNGLNATQAGYAGPFFSQFYGYGRINAAAAVQAANDYGFERDIYVRDNMADLGVTTSSSPHWTGVDIWVRNTNDGVVPASYATDANTVHFPPIFGQNNFLNIRYKNRGTLTSFPFYIRAYIAHYPGAEFTYPTNFIPTVRPNGVIPNPLTPGTYLIGEQLVNPVNAGQDGSIVMEWQQNLIPPQTVMVGGIDVHWHPCLLVEVSPQDGFVPTGNHVWENNNLAQKNLSISYPDDSADNASMVMLGNAFLGKLKYLKFVIFPDPIIIQPYFIFFANKEINRIFLEFAKNNPDEYKIGRYKNNTVAWVIGKTKISFELPNVGIVPMVIGLGKGEIKKDFALNILQYSGRAVSGSYGIEFRSKKA